jgi:hypothetical protein
MGQGNGTLAADVAEEEPLQSTLTTPTSISSSGGVRGGIRGAELSYLSRKRLPFESPPASSPVPSRSIVQESTTSSPAKKRIRELNDDEKVADRTPPASSPASYRSIAQRSSFPAKKRIRGLDDDEKVADRTPTSCHRRTSEDFGDSRFQGDHIPAVVKRAFGGAETRRLCLMCRSRVITSCVLCDVALCFAGGNGLHATESCWHKHHSPAAPAVGLAESI